MRPLALLLLLAACTPDFAAPSDVTDLRVLAVKAEPPEVLFDSDAGRTEPVAVTVLAVDPSRDAGPQAMQLEICGRTDSRRCDEGPVVDAGTVPLAFTLPPIESTDLGAFIANDDLAGYGGIRVQLSFTVDDGNPHGPVNGDKTLIYSPVNAPWLQPPDCARNHNPEIASLQLTIDGGPAGELTSGRALTIGTDYGVTPLLVPGSEERYCALSLSGNVLTNLVEQAHYAFFTGPGGSFDRDTAYQPLDGGSPPPDGLTRFTPGADGGTVWIVVRDGRGGESWVTRDWVGTRDGG